MPDIIKFHRGSSTYMNSSAGANIILAEGEIFVEYPDSGLASEGTKLKIGDGINTYATLPYMYLGEGGEIGGAGSDEEYPVMPINPSESEKKNGSIWIDDPEASQNAVRSHSYIRINPNPSELQNGSMWF